ncbi:transporter substrate-binding domain-containing protein [Ottowia beijingensis]|uniref:transporter substrate-binding domain-containing protein n=1 Tax=Ottowia beijingensis TaxID=1207057 RepID=UPI00363C88D5
MNPFHPLRTVAAALALGALTALGSPAMAQAGNDTLAKIRSSGKAVIGVREASPPMAYALGANTNFTGYHVELCERIIRKLVPQARLEYFAMTPQNTMPLVQNGTVDIGCGPATNNLTRQQQLAFAVTTYLSQVRMAVRADSGITDWKQLDGKTVSATTGTTAVQLLRRLERDLDIKINVAQQKDNLESLMSVENGRAAAFVLDDNLLAGVVANSRDPKLYKLAGTSLQSEPIAILFRKDDPAFKQAVDGELKAMMASGEMARHYDKWFMQPIPPRNVALNLPLSDELKALFAQPNDDPIESYNKR